MICYANEFKIFKAETGTEISFEQLVNDLKMHDVVFFGELHDDSLLHVIEKKLLTDLKKADNNFILGMEAFARDDQQSLNKYLSGEYSYEQLDANANLWSNYKDAYSEIVDLAKQDSIDILATNIPVKLSGLVAREGLSALYNLSEDNRNHYAREIKVFDNSYKNAFIAELSKFTKQQIDDGDDLILERLYQAQVLKDDTMAESIFDYLENNVSAKVLHINGDFHSRNHYGIYQKLELLNPNLNIASISPMPLPSDDLLEWNSSLYGKSEYVIMYHRDQKSEILNDKADMTEFISIKSHNISFIFEPSAKVITMSDDVTFNFEYDNMPLFISKDIKDLQIYQNDKKVTYDITPGKNEYNKLVIHSKSKKFKFVYIYDYPKIKGRPYNFNLKEYMWYPVAQIGEKSTFIVNALGPNKMKFIAPGKVTITPQRKDAIYYTWESFGEEYGFTVIGDLYFTKSIEVDNVLISFYCFEDDFYLLDDYIYFTEQYFQQYKQYFGDFAYDSFSIIQSADHNYKSFNNLLLVTNNVFKTKDIFITPSVFGHDLARIWIESKCKWNHDGANWSDILANFVSNYLWLENNKAEEAYLWRKDALEDITSMPKEEIKSLNDFTHAGNKFQAVNGYKIGGMILYYIYDQAKSDKFFASLKEVLSDNTNLSGLGFFTEVSNKTASREVLKQLEAIQPAKLYIRNPEFTEDKTKFSIISSQAEDNDFYVEIKLSNSKNFVKTKYRINKKETVLEFNFPANKIELDPDYKLYRKLDNREHKYNLKRSFLEKPLLLVAQDNRLFSEIYNIGNTLRTNGIYIDMMPLSSLKEVKWKEKSIIYIGEYANNKLFEDVQAYLPPAFEFGKNKFSYKGIEYSGDKYSLIINTQNPFSLDKSLSLWLWNSDKKIDNIQKIFDYTSSSWVILEFTDSDFREVEKGNLVDNVLFPTTIDNTIRGNY